MTSSVYLTTFALAIAVVLTLPVNADEILLTGYMAVKTAAIIKY